MKQKNNSINFHPGFFILCLGLSSKALWILGYVLSRIQPERDKFFFILSDCMSQTGYKTKKSIYEGLTELLKHGIIARGPTEVIYFINPYIFFKGDRVKYVKDYLRKRIDMRDN